MDEEAEEEAALMPVPEELTKEQEEKWGRTNKEIDAYCDNLHPAWRKFVFILTEYLTVGGGDAFILVSGPNNTGKTHTSLCILEEANRILRSFWKANPYPEGFLMEHPERRADVIDRFNIERDVLVCPTASQVVDFIRTAHQFQCFDINELMSTANNLQSLNRDVAELGAIRYINRNKHLISTWEIQVTKRTTSMMNEAVNVWMQKMSQKWFVLSVPSGLYRKSDPLYLKEIDKLRNDDDISSWFVHKNPNFIKTFLAPKLVPAIEERFAVHYIRSKEERARWENQRKLKK